ncbi:hypothetical protein APHAL10511_008060 [Amanita phalloides]|nr:hypothetical protein APHAL10511_008060 [Amanita phalloides]
MWSTLNLGSPLDNTMGALLIATVASAILYGMTLVQAYYYFILYSKDIPYLKMLVAILLIGDGTHSTLMIYTVYYYLVRNYYNPEKLGQVVWSLTCQTIFMILNSGLVQTYYALRVWRFGKNNLLLLAILVLVLAQIVSSAVWVVMMLQAKSYAGLLRLRPMKITISLMSTVIDVVNTMGLIILLRKSRTGLNKSDSLINRMIIFFFTTGMMPSICAIGALIAVTVFPETMLYVTFAACIGKLYTGSLIGTLNARRSLVQQLDVTLPDMQNNMTTLSTWIHSLTASDPVISC